MKIKHFVLLVAATVLVAGPSLAVERVYGGGNLVNTIYSPTAPGGCTTFDLTVPAGQIHPTTGCPTGQPDWLGRKTYYIIDDNGGGGATPTLVEGRQQSQLFNSFPCADTSVFDGGTTILGCRVEITTDTLFNTAGAGNIPATSIVASSPGDPYFPGWVVDWPDLGNDPLLDDGRGQYCNAYCDDATSIEAGGVACTAQEQTRLQAYCNGVLGLTQDAWDESSGQIIVVNPVDTGNWYFSADMTEYTIPGPFRYFALGNPGDPLYNVVYGLYTDGSASAPYAVPLAPLGALALGASLAYMGAASLRRKKQ
jgi:hypothetical protein